MKTPIWFNFSDILTDRYISTNLDKTKSNYTHDYLYVNERLSMELFCKKELYLYTVSNYAYKGLKVPYIKSQWHNSERQEARIDKSSGEYPKKFN